VKNKSRIALVGVLVKVVDPVGVEAAGPALDSMDHIPLLQEQLRQVGTVLTGDSGDQSRFGHGVACAVKG
jgi:hypothetical protein